VSSLSELPVPNLFLASLPEGDLAALRPHFETVRLSLRQVLHEIGAPIPHCYFSDGGMTSLLIRLEDGANIEAGVVGKEGFAGAAALMGFEDTSPYTSMIQMPGVGLRVGSGVLRTEMLRRPALLDRVHRFTQALHTQIATRSRRAHCRQSAPSSTSAAASPCSTARGWKKARASATRLFGGIMNGF